MSGGVHPRLTRRGYEEARLGIVPILALIVILIIMLRDVGQRLACACDGQAGFTQGVFPPDAWFGD
jgi:hypothetical protein